MKAEGKYDLAPESRSEGLQLHHVREVTETWQPPCVTCNEPLPYSCRLNSYRLGQTECEKCSGRTALVRLKASGISEIEIDQPLDALKPHGADGIPYGDDWTRYMAFLRRFAVLTPNQTMKPPFAIACGSNGVGKSAGAERALRDAIKNGCQGRSMRLSQILDAIYSTYNDEGVQGVPFFANMHLLVIHEVGSQTATEHAWSRFFDLVDDRSRNLKPTIFTMNYLPEENSLGAKVNQRYVDDATMMHGLLSRLRGSARENIFVIVGASWRDTA